MWSVVKIRTLVFQAAERMAEKQKIEEERQKRIKERDEKEKRELEERRRRRQMVNIDFLSTQRFRQIDLLK